MTEILCTSGAAKICAGVHASTAITNDPVQMTSIITNAEGIICVLTGMDWVTNYSGLGTEIKACLSATCAAFAGSQIVAYDNTGYLGREADMIMNFNDEIYNKGIIKLIGFKNDSLKNPTGANP